MKRIILLYDNIDSINLIQLILKQQIEHIAQLMQLNTTRLKTQAQIGKPDQRYNNKASKRRIKTQLDEPYIAMQSGRGQQIIRQQTKSQLGGTNINVAPILINKSSYLERQKCRTYYNNMGKAGLIRPQSTANHVVRFGNVTQRKTQRQRFIDILQNKILDSGSRHKPRYKTVEDTPENPKVSQRFASSQRHQDQIRPNSQTAKENPDAHRKIDVINHLKKQSLDQNKLEENRMIRNRSKTFTKPFVNDLNGQASPEGAVNEMSKTIQIESLKSDKMGQNVKKSTHKIAKLNLAFPAQKGTQQTLIDKLYMIKDTPREDNGSNLNVSTVKDTEAYNQQIKHLTNDFFIEWQKMNLTKSQIYQQLRNKFVKKFPDKRKHYTRYKLPEEQQGNSNLKKKQSADSYNIFNCDVSSMRISQNYLSSNKSQSNQLLQSQTKRYQDKYEMFKQKSLLKQIFKQACFWSRTKNRFMSESPTVEEAEAVKDLNQIKKRLTFMSYIKDKEGKGVLKCKNKIRGASIIRNKDSILQLEKQGSRQQIFLKKCLDDAIEDCIQENQ